MNRKCATVAFHGQYASPEILQRDMGDPDWVDWYAQVPYDTTSREFLADMLWDYDRLILIGYSLGGSLIGHLTAEIPTSKIVGAVLYESPLLNTDHVYGSFPVLWIRNKYKTTPRREQEFETTLDTWAEQHSIDRMFGTGRHMKFVWDWPPIAHAWDQSLNPYIAQWIKTVSQ